MECVNTRWSLLIFSYLTVGHSVSFVFYVFWSASHLTFAPSSPSHLKKKKNGKARSSSYIKYTVDISVYRDMPRGPIFDQKVLLAKVDFPTFVFVATIYSCALYCGQGSWEWNTWIGWTVLSPVWVLNEIDSFHSMLLSFCQNQFFTNTTSACQRFVLNQPRFKRMHSWWRYAKLGIFYQKVYNRDL